MKQQNVHTSEQNRPKRAMRESLMIPAIACAVLIVIFIVGEITQSQPVPFVADELSAVPLTAYEDPAAAIAKKSARIDLAKQRAAFVSDQAIVDAQRNRDFYTQQDAATVPSDETAQSKRVEDESNFAATQKEEKTEKRETIVQALVKKSGVSRDEKQKKQNDDQSRARAPVQEKKVRGAQQADATIDVSISVVGSTTYTVRVPAGSTASAAMSQAAVAGLSYTTKLYPGIGAYVTAIDGVSEDTRAGMYWIYYLNGVKAQAGISSTTLSDGDTIVWRLERGQ